MKILVNTLFAVGDMVWAGDELAEVVQVNYNICKDKGGRLREHLKYKVKYANARGNAWFNGNEIKHK